MGVQMLITCKSGGCSLLLCTFWTLNHELWSHCKTGGRLRSFLRPTKRKGFDTLFSRIAWELWKKRNARVFRNAAAPMPQLVQTIRHFGEQWVLVGAKKFGCLYSE